MWKFSIRSVKITIVTKKVKYSWNIPSPSPFPSASSIHPPQPAITQTKPQTTKTTRPPKWNHQSTKPTQRSHNLIFSFLSFLCCCWFLLQWLLFLLLLQRLLLVFFNISYGGDWVWWWWLWCASTVVLSLQVRVKW